MVGWALTKDWSEQLDFIFKQGYYRHLLEFLEYESTHNKTIYPPKDQMFNAFDLSSFKNTKVIILGQDPYHNEGQAHGLSFSVPDGVRVPPSLRNIYQELSSDLSITPSQSGNLTHWATQGVLLLNSALTVEKICPVHTPNQAGLISPILLLIFLMRKNKIWYFCFGALMLRKKPN